MITEDHYIDYLARENAARLIPAYLMARMRTSHFLFLGYGMRDWNLRVILRSIWAEQTRRFTSWAIQLAPERDRPPVLAAPPGRDPRPAARELGRRDARPARMSERRRRTGKAQPRRAVLAVSGARSVRRGRRGVVLRPRRMARDRARQPPRVPRVRALRRERRRQELAPPGGGAPADSRGVGREPGRARCPRARGGRVLGVEPRGPAGRAEEAIARRRRARRNWRRPRRARSPTWSRRAPSGSGDAASSSSTSSRSSSSTTPATRRSRARGGVDRGAFGAGRSPGTSSSAIREDSFAKLDRSRGGSRPPRQPDPPRAPRPSGAREAIERPLEHWNASRAGEDPDRAGARRCGARRGGGRDAARRAAGGAGRVRHGEREGTRIEAPYLQLVLTRIWDEERAARLEDPPARDPGAAGRRRADRAHAPRPGPRARSPGANATSRRRRSASSSPRRDGKIAHRPADLAAYAEVPAERLTGVLDALAGEPRILRPVAGGGVRDLPRRPRAGRARLAPPLRGEPRARARRQPRPAPRDRAVVAIAAIGYLGPRPRPLRVAYGRPPFRDPRRPCARNEVVLVAIDDRTFSDLGRAGRSHADTRRERSTRIAKDDPRRRSRHPVHRADDAARTTTP